LHRFSQRGAESGGAGATPDTRTSLKFSTAPANGFAFSEP
jgi:hypothetical protein